MDIVLSVALVGVLASCVTEIIKFIPYFKETKGKKKLLTIIVAIVGTGIYGLTSGDLEGIEFIPGLGGVLVASFGTYKGILKLIIPSDK